MKIKYSLVLIVGMFLSCGVTDVESKGVDVLPVLEQKIIAYEKELIEMAGQKGRIVDNQTVKNLFNVFSNGKVAYDRRYLVDGLRIIGVGTQFDEIHNGFIREPIIVELLVCALSDGEEYLRTSSFRELTDYAEWRLLPPHKAEIQKAIAKYEFWDPVKILCLLNLTDAEKQKWLKSEKTRTLAQRAALGDIVSEDSLIKLFQDAKTIGDFDKAAAGLAFVGSKKCRIALVKGLDTDIFWTYDPDVDVSGICTIVKELSRLHPEEPLLTKEYRDVKSPIYTKTGIVDDPKIKDYLTRLAKWGQSTYGVTLALPVETSFVRRMSSNGMTFTPIINKK